MRARETAPAWGLKGIGPAAAAALPALRSALGDPSRDVARLARAAIDAIEKPDVAGKLPPRDLLAHRSNMNSF